MELHKVALAFIVPDVWCRCIARLMVTFTAERRPLGVRYNVRVLCWGVFA